jgi:hypothetical protein
VLARGEVEVPRGGRASLELLVQPLEEPLIVPLAGRARASRAWGLQTLDVTAELLNEPPRGSALRFQRAAIPAPRSSDEEPASWEWSIPGGVQLGRWSVSVPKLGLGAAVDVPVQGLADVLIDVPDQVEVTVELRERSSDRPVPDARLGWMPRHDWSKVGGALVAPARERAVLDESQRPASRWTPRSRRTISAKPRQGRSPGRSGQLAHGVRSGRRRR